jgi:hypothetical protein
MSKVNLIKNHKMLSNYTKSQNKPWFNEDCKNLRSEYFKVKNKLRKIPSDDLKEVFRLKSKNYKKMVKITQKKFSKNLHKRLRELKSKNPKDYWAIINKASNAQDKIGNISMEIFMNHFKELSKKEIIDKNPNYNDSENLITNLENNSEFNGKFTMDEILKSVKK